MSASSLETKTTQNDGDNSMESYEKKIERDRMKQAS